MNDIILLLLVGSLLVVISYVAAAYYLERVYKKLYNELYEKYSKLYKAVDDERERSYKYLEEIRALRESRDNIKNRLWACVYSAPGHQVVVAEELLLNREVADRNRELSSVYDDNKMQLTVKAVYEK